MANPRRTHATSDASRREGGQKHAVHELWPLADGLRPFRTMHVARGLLLLRKIKQDEQRIEDALMRLDDWAEHQGERLDAMDSAGLGSNAGALIGRGIDPEDEPGHLHIPDLDEFIGEIGNPDPMALLDRTQMLHEAMLSNWKKVTPGCTCDFGHVYPDRLDVDHACRLVTEGLNNS